MESAPGEALRGLPFRFPHSHTIALRSGAAGLPAFALCPAFGPASFVPILRHLREARQKLTGCVVEPQREKTGRHPLRHVFRRNRSYRHQAGTSVSAGPRGEEHTDCPAAPGRREQYGTKDADQTWFQVQQKVPARKPGLCLHSACRARTAAPFALRQGFIR